MNQNENNSDRNILYLGRQIDNYPALRDRLFRAFLIALHSREIITMDELHDKARLSTSWAQNIDRTIDDDNVQIGYRWDEKEKEIIEQLVLEYAAGSLTHEEIDDIVNLTRKKEEAQTMEEIADLSSVSFRLLREKVKSFCRLPVGQTILPKHEAMGARVALTRHFISEHLEFIGVAKNYILIRDFDELVDRIIGDDQGMGKIGGKAAGMHLAWRILHDAQEKESIESSVQLAVPESYFLRSDLLEQFLRYNGLAHFKDQKYKSVETILSEYPMVMGLFKNADFPPVIVEQLREMLEEFGTHPLIVRSSSLLEDRFQTTFAGKYRSVFVSNQGTLDERLTEILGAIAEVYASVFHPDPISYRKRHNLIDYKENMAVLIQKIAGTRCGDYFLPIWAGTASSRNLCRRNPRVRPEDGLARVVLGLGTRAVDRVTSDFPRMIPLGVPTLRPEVSTEDVVCFSQKKADVINVKTRSLETVSVSDVLKHRGRLRINDVISVLEHGHLRPAMGLATANPESSVVTFDRFSEQSPYPKFLRWMLQTLEKAYDCPVEIEFAHDGEKLYLLQCRSQAIRDDVGPVRLPSDVLDKNRVFFADRDIINGSVHGIEYIVFIDPVGYNAISTDQDRLVVSQVVHRLNEMLADKSFILMGPGRWGGKDMRMGVPVGYSAINNTRMLIEIANPRDGYVPEASFGSHFFHDLIESDIKYLALYPGSHPHDFNDDFLHGSKSSLAELHPEFAELAKVVRVINVPGVARGRLLNVDMDGENQEALGYLT